MSDFVTGEICDIKHKELQASISKVENNTEKILEILLGNGKLGVIAKTENNTNDIIVIKECLSELKEITTVNKTRFKYALWLIAISLLGLLTYIIQGYLGGIG